MKSTIKTMLLVFLLASSFLAGAQGTYLSLVLGRDVSGSGLGGNVCPGLTLTRNRNTFTLGPNFQRQRMNFSGYQFNYRFAAATSQNEKFELYFAGNLTYHFDAFMSQANVEIEKSCHREQSGFEEMKLKVVEAYAGIGVRFTPIKQISIGCSTGVGMFSTLNSDYDREMFRDKNGAGVLLRAVLIYHLRK